jgi:hypothetical protein
MKKEKTAFTVRLEDEYLEKILKIATKEQRSMTGQIRFMLLEWLEVNRHKYQDLLQEGGKS